MRLVEPQLRVVNPAAPLRKSKSQAPIRTRQDQAHVAVPPSEVFTPGYPAETYVRFPMSYEEYRALPDKPKAEYANGAAYIMMAPADPQHNDIAGAIEYVLRRDLSSLKVLHETGLQMGEIVRIPDVMVIDRHAMRMYNNIQDAPLMVCEVLSPSTKHRDIIVKSVEYARFGAQQYWVVDPMEKSISIFDNHNGEWSDPPVAVVDAAHPEADVIFGNHGTVQLRFAEIFD